MMVWMGSYTQTFLPAVTETNAQMLDQSRIERPLRVLRCPLDLCRRRRTSMPANSMPSADDLLRFRPKSS